MSSKLIRDVLGDPIPQYEVEKGIFSVLSNGDANNVDFSKKKLLRDAFGDPLPYQYYDVESGEFVSGMLGGTNEGGQATLTKQAIETALGYVAANDAIVDEHIKKVASVIEVGHVQLSDELTDNSKTKAATIDSVKRVSDQLTSHTEQKANQTDAETGTSNEKWMTPLRTKEAIEALTPQTEIKVDNITIVKNEEGVLSANIDNVDIYKEGNEFTALTGSFEVISYGGNGSTAKNPNNLFASVQNNATTQAVRGFGTTNAINFAKIKKLYAKVRFKRSTAHTYESRFVLCIGGDRDTYISNPTAILSVAEIVNSNDWVEKNLIIDTSSLASSYKIDLIIRDTSVYVEAGGSVEILEIRGELI